MACVFYSRILFASAFALAASIASAATIQETFSGAVVSSQEELGLSGIFNSPVGTPVTGSFVFDTSAATPASGNTVNKATYNFTSGAVTLSANDILGSFSLSNPVVTATVALDAIAGQNGWEIYIARNPADEPVSEYFDVGLGSPLTGPVQIGTPVPPDGTVMTTSLSFFPTTFAPSTVGFAQFAVVNDPSNRFDFVDVDITSLGPGIATPEPRNLALCCIVLAALSATRFLGRRRNPSARSRHYSTARGFAKSLK